MPPKKATPGSKSKQASLMTFFENSAKKKDLRTRDENVALSSASSSTSTPVRTSPRRLHQQESKYPLDSTEVKKRVHNGAENSNTMTFYSGTLKRYSSEKGTYQVQLQNDTQVKTEIWTESDVEWGVFLHNTLGTKVAKYFDTVLYKGEIVDISYYGDVSNVLYRVFYEDGDSEDFNDEQLKQGKSLYSKQFGSSSISISNGGSKLMSKATQKKKRSSPTAPSATSSTKRVKKTAKDLEEQEEDDEEEKKSDFDTPLKKAATSEDELMQHSQSKRTKRSVQKTISYFDGDSDDESMKEVVSKTNSKTKSKRTKTSITKRKSVVESDSELEFECNVEETNDADDDDLDTDMEFDDDSSASPVEKPKASSSSKAKKRNSTEKKTNVKSNTHDSGFTVEKSDAQKELDQLVQKKMAWPVPNNPQKLPKEPYVDPLGIDPTDGIVEGIISGMVRKIGTLLQSAVQVSEKDRDSGEIPFPIKLQTACSGTDAPSIALGLIKEALNKLEAGQENNCSKTAFQYSHEMSCEIEPFKQAYIGRNFPGVVLFPDITKLTESETVADVYGRAQKIPEGNLFIAGTSCKDFSMLKSTNRKDIEDKGTSGETFLAAVEFLEQEQPNVAIFENVYNAPWDKMEEYIRGRVQLVNRNNQKSIIGKNSKSKAEKDLQFSVGSDGRYVVEVVPQQVGIRAGSIVEGFVRGGDDANNVRPLKGTESHTKGMINLDQLAKEHKINLDKDTLVLEKKTKYCTRLFSKCDTKEYGLPQTRQRKYLFIWKSDDPNDDLGDYFVEIMNHLKTPVLYSMEAFLLPDTHDRIRCFREALRSGPGLMVARERAKALDFWDWELSRIKDLASHLAVRKLLGLAERSRWITSWNTRGRKTVAPGLWPELAAMWNHRRCDLIDCFAAAAARDTISRDPLHHAFSWDLSQNVDRTSFRSSTVGVSGCVTPGGELLLPHRGRTMMGYEKLLLQGIPFSRLLLGPETEVQLSDLAGNAMSVPVVTATILAAICAPQLRRERLAKKDILLDDFALSQKYDSSNGAVLPERGDLHADRIAMDLDDFSEIFANIAKELALDAYHSSVLCTCESSGRTTQDHKILACTCCGFGICHSCSDQTQIISHDLKEIKASEKNASRPDPHAFEAKLRCAVPSTLRMGNGWENSIKECAGLESYTFQLQQVSRKKRHWTLTYGAWEDFGSGRQVGEIRVIVGRLSTLDPCVGYAAYVKCYAPAIRYRNPKRGTIKDSARILMKTGQNENCQEEVSWQVRSANTKQTLRIVGSNPCPSLRVEIGLSDESAKAIKNHKVTKDFIPKLKSRNDLINYHPLWKTWPGQITITGDATDTVNGTYTRLSCRHTIVLSALWRREQTDCMPPLYLFFRPDVIRTGLDVAVISTSPSYHDELEICEFIDWIPENSLTEKTYDTEVTFLHWVNSPHLTVKVPPPTLTMTPSILPFHEQLLKMDGNDNEYPIISELNGMSAGVIKSLLQHSDVNVVDSIVHLDLVGKAGTQNAKKLSILAAPSLLKYAAESKLPLELSVWFKLQSPRGFSFGLCENYFPSRPVEKWEEVQKRKGSAFVRFYDADESNQYYAKLLQRPTAFDVSVDKSRGTFTVRMNPFVAAHQAAAYLVRGRGLSDHYAKSLDVEYCLSELSSMGEPNTEEFHVPSSDAYDEADGEKLKSLGLLLPLYPRQAKALTRMQSIERGEVDFLEEERSEHMLHGIGWTLIARARRKVPLKGGVLGDAIGSGKTVVTIALILSGVEAARKNRNVSLGKSGATLIVVPPGLLKQWDDERKKFTGNRLKCITIDSTKSLMRYSIQEICSADVVIVPAGIIEEKLKATDRPYTKHLSKMADSGAIPPAPSSYSQKEAPSIEGTWVRNMSSGPMIYVGNNGKQRTRDEQAYYGYCYANAIKKLREKKFQASERGVPLEYFTWERVIIDECHESLVTAHGKETTADDFKQQARRGAREFLGVSHLDVRSRPLIASTAIWGLTGTPLLETEARVTELANLMGGAYLTGSAHHWRREERDSGRDLFLNQQEGSKSREYRCAVQSSCHSYVRTACQRNRGQALEVKLERKQKFVNMSASEGADFLSAIKSSNLSSYSISPDQIGDRAAQVLNVTATSKARHAALLDIIDSIQVEEPDTKIIIFANAFYGGFKSALVALQSSKHEFCHINDDHSVFDQNEIISYFRHADATDEDRRRPRILLLSFEQAAGHNLQEACHNVIMFDPMYSGQDAVADASQEEQALGRVLRQGQKCDVSVTRIIVKGPNGERCLDDWIVERNLDEDVLRAATSNFD